MDGVYVYLVDLPDGINEMVTPCEGGSTVYLDAKLTREGLAKAYSHALRHIMGNDHEKTDVQEIERKVREAT